MVSTHDAGNDIGHPQPRFGGTPAMFDVQTGFLRQVEPSLLDGQNITTIQHLLPGLHEQLPYPEPVQLEGEATQADRSCALLLARCDRGCYRNHRERIEVSKALCSSVRISTALRPRPSMPRPPAVSSRACSRGKALRDAPMKVGLDE